MGYVQYLDKKKWDNVIPWNGYRGVKKLLNVPTDITSDIKNKRTRQSNRLKTKLEQIPVCKYCKSSNIILFGIRRNAKGNDQRYRCRECKKTFTNSQFLKMKHSKNTIQLFMWLYNKGHTPIQITRILNRKGASISYKTVWKWVKHERQILTEVAKP